MTVASTAQNVSRASDGRARIQSDPEGYRVRSQTANLAFMRSAVEIADFLERQPQIISVLRLVEALAIEDCWIGAGFIRNAIWDHLHGQPIAAVPGSA